MQALDRLGSVYQHANLPQHHWLEFKKKGGGGASLKAQPLCCQSNAFPLSCPFSTALGRPLFNSIRRVTARLRSLISSGCPYRESTAQRITGRRWPNRRREAGRTAATLDELLIWTNREAVGGVLGQQEIQRWKAAEVFCYEALTAGSLYSSYGLCVRRRMTSESVIFPVEKVEIDKGECVLFSVGVRIETGGY